MTTEPPPAIPHGERWFRISETQLKALMSGWTHTSLSDKKGILSTVFEDQMIDCGCPTHTSPVLGTKRIPCKYAAGDYCDTCKDKTCTFFYHSPHTSPPAPEDIADLLIVADMSLRAEELKKRLSNQVTAEKGDE